MALCVTSSFQLNKDGSFEHKGVTYTKASELCTSKGSSGYRLSYPVGSETHEEFFSLESINDPARFANALRERMQRRKSKRTAEGGAAPPLRDGARLPRAVASKAQCYQDKCPSASTYLGIEDRIDSTGVTRARVWFKQVDTGILYHVPDDTTGNLSYRLRQGLIRATLEDGADRPMYLRDTPDASEAALIDLTSDEMQDIDAIAGAPDEVAQQLAPNKYDVYFEQRGGFTYLGIRNDGTAWYHGTNGYFRIPVQDCTPAQLKATLEESHARADPRVRRLPFFVSFVVGLTILRLCPCIGRRMASGPRRGHHPALRRRRRRSGRGGPCSRRGRMGQAGPHANGYILPLLVGCCFFETQDTEGTAF